MVVTTSVLRVADGTDVGGRVKMLSGACCSHGIWRYYAIRVVKNALQNGCRKAGERSGIVAGVATGRLLLRDPHGHPNTHMYCSYFMPNYNYSRKMAHSRQHSTA